MPEATTPGVALAPPTQPGGVPRERAATWPRVVAVLCWIHAALSVALAAGTLGYPAFSAWLKTKLGPDGHDDLAGVLTKHRWLDAGTEVLTLVLGVGAAVIGVWMWRARPGAARRLRVWCVAKLVLFVANLGLLWVQAGAHFATRGDLLAGQQTASVLGFIGWSVAVGLPFPLCVLAWLLTPGVRRSGLMTGG